MNKCRWIPQCFYFETLVFFSPIWLLLRDGDPGVSFLYIIGGCSVKLLVTPSPHHLHGSVFPRSNREISSFCPSLTYFLPYVTFSGAFWHFKKWKCSFFFPCLLPISASERTFEDQQLVLTVVVKRASLSNASRRHVFSFWISISTILSFLKGLIPFNSKVLSLRL